MKKLIIIILFGILIGTNANAYINFWDDFEDYEVGIIIGQGTWEGANATGTTATTSKSYAGTQSMALTNPLGQMNLIEAPSTNTTGTLGFRAYASEVTTATSTEGVQIYTDTDFSGDENILQIICSVAGCYLRSIVGGTVIITHEIPTDEWGWIEWSINFTTDKQSLSWESPSGSWDFFEENATASTADTSWGDVNVYDITNGYDPLYIDNFFLTVDDETNAECFDIEDSALCWATNGCFWDTASEPDECKPQGYYEGQCGDYQLCQYCESKTSCLGTASSTCVWNSYLDILHEGWDNVISRWYGSTTSTDPSIWGCSWDIQYEEQATTSTSSPTGVNEELRDLFGNRMPFAYFFAIQDKLYQLSYENTTGTIESIAITIPTTTFPTTTQGAHVWNSWSITILSQEEIYKFVPQTTWDIIKELLAGAILIGLLFWIINQIDKIHNIDF